MQFQVQGTLEVPCTWKVTDVENPVSGLIRVNGGGSRKSRAIPLNTKIFVALSNYLKMRPKVSKVLFFNKFERPLGKRGMEKVVSKFARMAGVPGASVHSLRHTFGTQHAAKGTSLKTIQDVMGHKDARTTEIYFLMAEELRRKEMEANAL